MTVGHPDPAEIDPAGAGRHDADPERHPLMTVVEVAAALRVSKATVYRLVQSGVIPGKRTARTVRISRHVVEELLRDDHANPSPIA